MTAGDFIALAALGVSIWNAIKIREVHVIMNSRLSELLTSTGKEQFAAGRREGLEKSSQKSSQKASAPKGAKGKA